MSREKNEILLTKAIARQLTAQKQRIIDKAEAPLSLNDSFWSNEDNLLSSNLLKELKRIADEAAELTMNDFPVSVDLALLHGKTLAWAKQYSFELVKGINKNTRDLITKALNEFYTTPGFNLQDFIDVISPSFGPVRAEMIAVTETTRAYSKGTQTVADLISQQGIELDDIWNTEEDELVCPICGPRNNKKKGDGWNDNPPAHPRCRCFVSHVLRDRNQRTILLAKEVAKWLNPK